ncbi:MAG: AraC family transcriptional regulator ligand-binding domain-containing protein [Burkholderiaceae bacterium]
MAVRATHPNIVRAVGLAGFQELVAGLGGDPVALLREGGLRPADLADPQRYVPYRSAAAVIEEAARSLGVRDFGLRLCAAQDVNALGILALIMQSASSVREGMLLGGKYIYFHSPAWGYRSFRDPDDGLECVEVFQLLSGLPDVPQITEMLVGYMCRMVAMLSDRALRPVRIHFRHARLGSEAQYRRHLGQIPCFKAAFDGIAMDPLAWRQPIPGRSQILQDFVERFLLGLSPGPRPSAADQVGAVLGNLVRVDMADLATVARALGQHPRTLQRRLRVEGARFELLRDAARKAWARELLDQPGLGLAQVAQMLGFADQSVLTRACRRWFGDAPKRLRVGAEAARGGVGGGPSAAG